MTDQPKRQLFIVTRRWFNRTQGNTYYSAVAYLDGKLVYREPYDYGFGSHGTNTAINRLMANKVIPDLKRRDDGRALEALWEYTGRTGIDITSDECDVDLKRDLHGGTGFISELRYDVYPTEFDTYDYNVSGHLLPYLINSDSSGLDDDEVEAADAFMTRVIGDRQGHISAGEHKQCDISGLDDNCQPVQVHLIRK